MTAAYTLAQAFDPPDLADVRQLCWDYRTYLLHHSGTDRDITETFYPVEKYEILMAALATEHARPSGNILLARDTDGAPLACGMSHALDAQTSEIKRVFTTDKARGMGLARTLCTALIDQARTDGFARVVLDTSRTLIAAQSLYASLGFTACGPYQPIPEIALPHLVFYELAL